mmetsp:Transcript_12584/g.28918  ORF Transcript_12584/g.28918 Transcript_12584/m.28918 type:complete len:319 (+) Transcript_12584:574-1530(+)
MVPAHRVQEVGELAQVDRVHRVRLDGSLVVDLRRVVVVLHLSHKRRVRAQHVAVPGRLLDGATEESIGLVVLVQHRSQVECKRRQVCPVGRICSHSLLEQPAVVVNGVLASARAEQGEAREHSRVLVLARCQRSGEQALRPGVVLLARLHEVREVEEEVDVIRADLDGPLEHALCLLVVTSHVPEKHREVSQQPGVLRGALDRPAVEVVGALDEGRQVLARSAEPHQEVRISSQVLCPAPICIDRPAVHLLSCLQVLLRMRQEVCVRPQHVRVVRGEGNGSLVELLRLAQVSLHVLRKVGAHGQHDRVVGVTADGELE